MYGDVNSDLMVHVMGCDSCVTHFIFPAVLCFILQIYLLEKWVIGMLLCPGVF